MSPRVPPVVSGLLLAALLVTLGAAAVNTERIEPDEATYVELALALPLIHPDRIDYLHGGLPYTVLSFVFGVGYLGLLFSGQVGGQADFLRLYLERPDLFLGAARLVVVLVFGAALLGVRALAQRLLPEPMRAVAILLIATNFALVFMVVFVKAEIFSVALLAWAAAAAIPREDDPHRIHPARAGLLAGLAGASSYLSAFAIPGLAALLLVSPPGWRHRVGHLTRFGVAMALGFTLGHPWAVVFPGRVLAALAAQGRLWTTVPEGVAPTISAMLPGFLWSGVTPFALAVTLVGLASLTIIPGRRRGIAVALSLHALGLFIYFAPKYGAYFRYLAPSLPFLLLAGLVGLSGLAESRPRIARPMLAALVLVLVTGIPRVVRLLEYNLLPSSASLSQEWIERNVPSNESVLVEGLVVNRVFWCPSLPRNRMSLEAALREQKRKGASGRVVEAEIARCCQDPSYLVNETDTIQTAPPETRADWVVTCRDDEPPIHASLNWIPESRQKRDQELGVERREWLEARHCTLAHEVLPRQRLRGPLIDTFDPGGFQRIVAGGVEASGPRVRVYRCANSAL